MVAVHYTTTIINKVMDMLFGALESLVLCNKQRPTYFIPKHNNDLKLITEPKNYVNLHSKYIRKEYSSMVNCHAISDSSF